VKSAEAVVVGAGPAGLRAAEVLLQSGLSTHIFDHKPSLGRKFLVAGRGGLNITHSEPLTNLAGRYDDPGRWERMLSRFTPADLRRWFEGLGVTTYVGTSGRVFPASARAPEILERWLERLYEMDCEIQTGHRLVRIRGDGPYQLTFDCADRITTMAADIVVLALGGASWPQTGSDGTWVEMLTKMGISLVPFRASNVGWEYPWSDKFLAVADGRPLKNLQITCNKRIVRGELMITRYGLEGGAIYQLTRALRENPEIEIDFKPGLSLEDLRRRLKPDTQLERAAFRSWRLNPAALALLADVAGVKDAETLLAHVKNCRMRLLRPRPISEAISCSGGVDWSALDEDLMLRDYPGIFCAGEMIDWDAPTGGYLLQGSFVTGTIAGQGAAKWIAQLDEA
jgi:uncharacterized flavoprotein (TIGR03862 family)